MSTSPIVITARTKSATETVALGRAIASVILPGDVVALDGELGTGKTTFVQGFAAGLGSDSRVTSPTYTYANTYRGDGVEIVHLDLYRCSAPVEVEELGLLDSVDEDAVVIAEWAERGGSLLATSACRVVLGPGEMPNSRLIEIQLIGTRWKSREGVLRQALATWALGE